MTLPDGRRVHLSYQPAPADAEVAVVVGGSPPMAPGRIDPPAFEGLGFESSPLAASHFDFSDTPFGGSELLSVRCASVGEAFVAVSPPSNGQIPLPRNGYDAIADPQYGEKWKEAMINDIVGKQTKHKLWRPVKSLPPGRRPMGGKWVFRVVYKLDGSVEKFKARWVGKGFTQIAGIDYDETFCSTLRHDSQKYFFADACACDNDLEECDIEKAFPSSDADDRELFIDQPECFEKEGFVACQLTGNLEGTRQAGNQFMKTHALAMERCGFTRLSIEPNIYVRTEGDTTIKIGCYVDNLLISSPKSPKAKAMVAAFKAEYRKRFTLEDRGEPEIFIGMQITRVRHRRLLTICQTKHIEETFEQYLSGTCTKHASTPLASMTEDEFMSIKGADDDAERAAMRNKSYLALMGSLNWTVNTRPDIAFYVSFLCTFMQCPSRKAWDAGLGVLAYLYATRHMGITFDGNKPVIVAYSDSSWGQSPRPFSGHVVFFCGAASSYSSRKMKIVPQSTGEAETAAYANCAKDLRFAQQLLAALGLVLSLPTNIMCDGDAAVKGIKKPGVTMRNRHYESWLHYGREQYLNKVSTPVHVSRVKMIADIFTHTNSKTEFIKFRDTLLNVNGGQKLDAYAV